MVNDLLSIVVPTYNVDKYLTRCLDSLLNQTYNNIEVIVVDDGSTDSSGVIAERYKKIDGRVKVIHKENGGLSDARNVGIKASKGKYIAFVDSDDFIEPDIYEKSMLKIKNANADILVFEIIKNYSSGIIKKFKLDKEEKIDKVEAIIQLNSFKNIDFSACNKIYKKELFNNIEFPLNKKCEDVYTMYKIFNNAKYIYLLPEEGYHYCLRDGSITTSNNVNIDYSKALKEQMIYFDGNNKLDVVVKSSYAYSCLAIVNLIILKKLKNKALIKKMKKESRYYSKYVYKNKYLSFRKKMQYFIYDYLFLLYVFIIKKVKK